MKVMNVKEWKKMREEKTSEDVFHDELGFILAQKIATDLFLLQEISMEEYRKIKRENILKYRPLLGEIML